MKVQTVGINQINPAAYNPRVDLKPGDAEYEKLTSSLKKFGCVENLVWNSRTGNLVSGHQRLKVMKDLGYQEVDVVVVDLSLPEEKMLNLALNKISGDWDEDKLASLLEDLRVSAEDDIVLTGFDQEEISALLDQAIEPPAEDAFDGLIQPKETITKRGDLIVLNRHRVFCGDAANPDDVAWLMDGKKIDLVFTDPPYAIEYVNLRGLQGKYENIENDDLPQPEYEEFLRKVLTNIVSSLATGAPVYLFNGHRQFGPMYLILTQLGIHVSTVLTWAKQSFTFGRGDYKQQTEFLLYGWKDNNGAHRWYGPDNESTLWQIKRESAKELIHATQKPLALLHRVLRNSSLVDDIVADFFLGSGTTLIAAQGLNRTCYAMEISEANCDLAVRRYISYVGEENVSEEIRSKYLIRGGVNGK